MNKEMLKKIRIKVGNTRDKVYAMAYLANLLGVPVNKSVMESVFRSEKDTMKYPYIGYHCSSGSVSAYMVTDDHDILVEFGDIDRIPDMVGDSFVMQLNGNHNAEYKKGDKTIKVGCQTFEIAKLDELVDRIRKMNSDA